MGFSVSLRKRLYSSEHAFAAILQNGRVVTWGDLASGVSVALVGDVEGDGPVYLVINGVTYGASRNGLINLING